MRLYMRHYALQFTLWFLIVKGNSLTRSLADPEIPCRPTIPYKPSFLVANSVYLISLRADDLSLS